jgi:ferredoxin-NADP reductase
MITKDLCIYTIIILRHDKSLRDHGTPGGHADWPGHRAGQHLDVRLTAEDGYVAERSYSIASAAEPLAITVERLEDGEVSPYLTQELRAGDELELRGSIGGYFVWGRVTAGR